MADYPMQHGRTHCPTGSDPIPCLGGGVGYAYIQWNNGSVSMAANTWTGIDNADTFNQDYGEGFESAQNPAGFTVTLTNDIAMIEWDGTNFNYPLVLLSAWVEWSDTGFVDGDEIGVGIVLGKDGTAFTAPRYINTIPIGADDPDIENEKVTVQVVVPGSFNKNAARVFAWQSSSAAKNCANSHLSAISLLAWQGTFYP